MNKDPEEGIRELREAGRKFKLTYSYAVLLFGLGVFTFVQYVLFTNSQQCKKSTPMLYIWLVCETVIFYVTLFLFLVFGGYYAWRKARTEIKHF